METSKIAAVVALVVIAGAIIVSFAAPDVGFAPKPKQTCTWTSGFFNPIEETENLGGSDCTGNDYDPFKTGSILYTVNGTSFSHTDFCASSSLMNEYWCSTNGAGQRVLGYCTLGCKIGTDKGPTGSCVSRVRVCGPSPDF